MRFNVDDTVVCIFPPGSTHDAIVVRNEGPGTVYLDSNTGITPAVSVPLKPTCSIVWDYARPLYATSETSSTLRIVSNANVPDKPGIDYTLLGDVSSGFSASADGGYVTEPIEVAGFETVIVRIKMGERFAADYSSMVTYTDYVTLSLVWFDSADGKRNAIRKDTMQYGVPTLNDVVLFIPVKGAYLSISNYGEGLYNNAAGTWSATGFNLGDFEAVRVYGITTRLVEYPYITTRGIQEGEGPLLSMRKYVDPNLRWGFNEDGSALTAYGAATRPNVQGAYLTLPTTLNPCYLFLERGNYRISLHTSGAVTTAGSLYVLNPRVGFVYAQITLPASASSSHVVQDVTIMGDTPIALRWQNAGLPVLGGGSVLSITITPL